MEVQIIYREMIAARQYKLRMTNAAATFGTYMANAQILVGD
jgi:hypothetical protein